MKSAFFLTFIAVFSLTNATPTCAQPAAAPSPHNKASAAVVALPAGITEEMLSPPPVPRFMLEKPAKPLTMDEMLQQARDAERKADIQPAAPTTTR